MKLPNQPKVLAATYNPVSSTKMISFLVDFPTVLLAELRTHRILTQGSLYEHSELIDFNMSANSARAIPTNKYLQKINDNPFIPIWTKKQSGMSGEIMELDEDVNYHYQYAVNSAINNHKTLSDLRIHKQNANRLLAPFAYTTCILSGTEWEHFFELRCPKYEFESKQFLSKKQLHKYLVSENMMTADKKEPEWEFFCQSINKSSAQPEFQIIAEMLYDLYQEADWKESKYHIPFYDDINYNYSHLLMEKGYDEKDWFETVMKISASMCAKLSYNTQNNEDTLEKHLERAEYLIENKPSEPFSHQAVAMDCREFTSEFFSIRKVGINYEEKENEHLVYEPMEDYTKGYKLIKTNGKCYNLTGFISQRYILENY
jgi:hypothetical protein